MKNQSPDNFAVILAYQRSGTHFLGSCLDSHPQIKYVGEIFGQSPNLQHPGEQFGKENGFHKLKQSDHGIERSLELLTSEFINDKKAKLIVMDIKYNQITHPLEHLLHDLKVIHLIRKDLRRRFFSMLLWEKYKKYPVLRSFGVIPHFDISEAKLKRNMAEVKRLQEKYSYLEDLRLYYEELTQNHQVNRLPTSIEKRLCGFLGLDWGPLSTLSIKIAPINIDEFIHRKNE